MTEPQDVLAEALADVMEPPGWQVLGSTMPIRAQAAYHHAAAAILASLDGRGYALVRTPETLDARGMGAIEAAWFALARDFTYTGPHDRETAHDIVVQHRPAIEAALRLAASPAPDPGAGLREAAQKVIDSCEYVDGTAQQMADDRALDRLRAALAASPAPDPGATWCSTCGHERRNHSSGGLCDGGGTECHCVRFPDAPDFAAPSAEPPETEKEP